MDNLIDMTKNELEQLGINEYHVDIRDNMFLIYDNTINDTICYSNKNNNKLCIYSIDDIELSVDKCFENKVKLTPCCNEIFRTDKNTCCLYIKRYFDSRKAYLETINALQEQLKELNDDIYNARKSMSFCEYFKYRHVLYHEFTIKAKQMFKINLRLGETNG